MNPEPETTEVPAPPPSTVKTKKPKGFAALSKEQRQAISKLGGKAAHAKGTAHQFSAEEAREAGRKGGLACAEKKAGIHKS